MKYTQEEWNALTMSEQAEAWDAMSAEERLAVRPDLKPESSNELPLRIILPLIAAIAGGGLLVAFGVSRPDTAAASVPPVDSNSAPQAAAMQGLKLIEFDYRLLPTAPNYSRVEYSWKAVVKNESDHVKRFQIWLYGYDQDGFKVHEAIMQPIVLTLMPHDEETFSNDWSEDEDRWAMIERFRCVVKEL